MNEHLRELQSQLSALHESRTLDPFSLYMYVQWCDCTAVCGRVSELLRACAHAAVCARVHLRVSWWYSSYAVATSNRVLTAWPVALA